MSETQALLDGIAYIAWHEHRVIEQSAGSVKIAQPARADLLNYVGGVHAGAMYTLAESAAGVAADSIARPIGAYILLRGAEVKYKRRASGALTARAQADETARRDAVLCFKDSGRADFSVTAIIFDSEDKVTFEGDFHYALRARTS